MSHSRSVRKFKKMRNSFLIRQLANAFILNKGWIKTTISRAKCLRMFLEPLITLARKQNQLRQTQEDDETLQGKVVAIRRHLIKKLHNKKSVKILSDTIVPLVATREQGGYLRIVRCGIRADASTMAWIGTV